MGEIMELLEEFKIARKEEQEKKCKKAWRREMGGMLVIERNA